MNVDILHSLPILYTYISYEAPLKAQIYSHSIPDYSQLARLSLHFISFFPASSPWHLQIHLLCSFSLIHHYGIAKWLSQE